MEKILKTSVAIILFIITIYMQLFIFNNVQVFGVKPNLILISIIVMGVYTNLYSSSIFSFVIGFFMDLLLGGNGIYTISYTIIGMIVGFVSDSYMRDNYIAIVLLTIGSVIAFEFVQYATTMILISKYISFIFFLKQIILGILLDVILVMIICFLFGKLMAFIDKKQNKIYW